MLDEFDIPIFKKVYDLYLFIYGLRGSVPKQDRHALWLQVENTNLEIIKGILKASELYQYTKIPVLEEVSIKLNTLRILIRLSFDTKIINGKKYTRLQQQIDEIGRMLGGWMRKLKKQKKEEQVDHEGAGGDNGNNEENATTKDNYTKDTQTDVF